jgi:hypothetical protein
MATYLALSTWKCEVIGKKGDPVKWAPPVKVFANTDDQAICLARQRVRVGAKLMVVKEAGTNRRIY